MFNLSAISWSRIGVAVGAGALEALVGYLDSNTAVFGGATVMILAAARQLDHILLGWKPVTKDVKPVA